MACKFRKQRKCFAKDLRKPNNKQKTIKERYRSKLSDNSRI